MELIGITCINVEFTRCARIAIRGRSGFESGGGGLVTYALVQSIDKSRKAK